jgi:phage terminase large subunit
MVDKTTENLAKLLADWRMDPRRFPREAFDPPFEPEAWHDDVLSAFPHEDRIAMRSGNGVGKTFLLALLILLFAVTRYPYKIPCTAPSAAQLSSALWPELGKLYRRLHPALRRMLRLTSDRLELVSSEGTSFAEARTSRADQPEALQGFHEDNLLFIVDEASGVPDIVFAVGAGSLSTRGAKIVLAGNPTRTSGYFFDAFHPKPGQRPWWIKQISGFDSSRVDPSWIEEMKAQYGEDSEEYAVRVEGNFPRSDSFSFFPKHLVEQAVQRRALIELFPGPVVWGVDVGWQGDRSAVAKRMGSHLLEPVTWWAKLDTMETVGRVMRMYDETPRHMQPKEILVDVIGIGAGVYSRLKEQGLPAQPVNVSKTAEDTGQYPLVRQELYGRAREWLSLTDSTLPDDVELITEMNHLQGKMQSNGRIYPESKTDMKGRKLRSPDILESWILTFAASTRWYRASLRLVDEANHLPAQTSHTYDPRSW